MRATRNKRPFSNLCLPFSALCPELQASFLPFYCNTHSAREFPLRSFYTKSLLRKPKSELIASPPPSFSSSHTHHEFSRRGLIKKINIPFIYSAALEALDKFDSVSMSVFHAKTDHLYTE